MPATRYAVGAYVDFVTTRTHLEAVASSLTELFSKDLITLRVDRLREHYPWLSSGLEYFQGRMTQAPEDADFALDWVVKHARNREEQELALAALRAKCDILWASWTRCISPTSNPAGRRPARFVPAKESA